jgi:hypothetical protein
MSDPMARTDNLHELDHRRGSGLDVTLYWDRDREGVLVSVSDARSGDYFVLRPANVDARDAFRHPYGYAARHGTAVSVTGRTRARGPVLRTAER